MAFVGKQFDNLQEMMDYLNGLIGGSELSYPLALDGLTLIVNDGADKTVTFSGDALVPKEVVAQINAVKAGAVTLRNYGYSSPPSPRLLFILAGLKVKSTGTANSLLGLPTSGADQTVGAAAVPKANIVAVDEWAGRYTVIHE